MFNDFRNTGSNISADALYRILGLEGCVIGETRLENDELLVTASQPRESLRCPGCGTARLISQGRHVRRIRTLPVGRHPVRIELDVPRVRCHRCGIVRQVRIPFTDRKRRRTQAFERYDVELVRITTTRQAARHLGVSWDTIRDIERRFLQKHFAKPKLKSLKRIAIRKGHRS